MFQRLQDEACAMHCKDSSISWDKRKFFLWDSDFGPNAYTLNKMVVFHGRSVIVLFSLDRRQSRKSNWLQQQIETQSG